MVMLTIYFGLNLTINYPWLLTSMLNFSLDKKFLNFTCKAKLTLSCETLLQIFVLNQTDILMQKKKVDTSSQLYYGKPKWKKWW